MNHCKFSLLHISASILLLVGPVNSVRGQERVAATPEAVSADRVQADPLLQTRISLDLNDKPLRVVLEAISRQTGVPVRAETNLQEYRVSLHTTAQPLITIMQRLVDLFGHGDLPNKNYGWSHTLQDKKTHYVLTRNARAYEQEQAMLDLPLTRRIQWLKDLREFLHLPADKRKTFRSDYPGLEFRIQTGEGFEGDPGAEAIAALSDEQMNTLMREGKVEIPQLTLSTAALTHLQKAVPQGHGVTSDFDDYNPPSQARLSIQEDGKQRAHLRGVSSLSLNFSFGFPRYCPMGFAFDTLGQLPDGDTATNSDITDGSPQINLLAHEPASQGRRPHITLAVALRLLAREAAINIYAETFPKSPLTLFRTKGTLEGLLKSICHTYGCEWRKVGSDYVVYSKAWAQDRAADIAQPVLDHWRSSYVQHNRYMLQDLIEMASLKEEQQATVIDVLNVQSPFGPQGLPALQLLSLISPHDIAQAYLPQGVPITNLDEAHLSAAKQLFHSDAIALPLQIHLRYIRTVHGPNIQARYSIDITDSANVTVGALVSDYSRLPSPTNKSGTGVVPNR